MYVCMRACACVYIYICKYVNMAGSCVCDDELPSLI
jgi:hypothetical protein